MKKILILIAAVAAQVAPVFAADDSRPTANLAVTYKYSKPNIRSKSLKHTTDEMMLMVAPEASRFYSVKTQFYDSLAAAPGGREMINNMVTNALNSSNAIQRDASGKITSITITSDMRNTIPRRGVTTIVEKYPEEGRMQVVDELPADETYYTYDVPMDELVWETGDSTTVILGYECQNATADYHGRHWTAWFTPDIPVSDGPWQLCGLPGLILEAKSDGGEYIFTATGIHEINEPLPQIPGDPVFEKMSRKEYLKTLVDLEADPGKAYGITNTPAPLHHDQIETDYND